MKKIEKKYSDLLNEYDSFLKEFELLQSNNKIIIEENEHFKKMKTEKCSKTEKQ